MWGNRKMHLEHNTTLELQKFFPVDGTYDLIQATKNLQFNTILDIGVGKGGAAAFFAQEGKSVTGICPNLNIDSELKSILNEGAVTLQETTFEMFGDGKKFDAIWASHVLEHVQNPGDFLKKARNILSDHGWLMILVPKFKHNVVGGHISKGWNTGQLMYNLLLSGFNIKNGHFIDHGYSVCAFVQKTSIPLPKLRMDGSDIETTKHLWPMPVFQGFDGDIKNINWFNDFKVIRTDPNDLTKNKEDAYAIKLLTNTPVVNTALRTIKKTLFK